MTLSSSCPLASSLGLQDSQEIASRSHRGLLMEAVLPHRTDVVPAKPPFWQHWVLVVKWRLVWGRIAGWNDVCKVVTRREGIKRRTTITVRQDLSCYTVHALKNKLAGADSKKKAKASCTHLFEHLLITSRHVRAWRAPHGFANEDEPCWTHHLQLVLCPVRILLV